MTATYRMTLCCFFFNHPPPTEIYTLSLHDALPISYGSRSRSRCRTIRWCRSLGDGVTSNSPSTSSYRGELLVTPSPSEDRKSTRLNSSHVSISYAVFCLKKKKKIDKRYGKLKSRFR